MQNPSGVVAGNAQNVPEAHTSRTRSTFPLHYHFFNTHRFGEYVPHFVAEMNKDEIFPIHSSHDLRSYTLEAPLMQNVKRNKDYFLVPMEAILPFNWEKFYDNPVRGDDVPDDVGPSVDPFWSQVGSFMNSLYNALYGSGNGSILLSYSGGDNLAHDLVTACIRFFVLSEYFYSNGNLLASLGCHGAPYFTAKFLVGASGGTRFGSPYEQVTIDDIFDRFCNILVSHMNTTVEGASGVFSMVDDGITYIVSSNPQAYGFPTISLRHCLQLFRDNPNCYVNSLQSDLSLDTQWSGLVQELKDLFASYTSSWFNTSANVPCDLSRVWAYQLCCAHYFSNDHIDFVYSAELYRQLIGSYLYSLVDPAYFVRNGINYQYDFLSAHYFSAVVGSTTSQQGLINLLIDHRLGNTLNTLGYLSAVFSYRRSLRYLDYFTGSRSQPLAVVNTNQINTNVSVNNNQVSVIDITKSIQAQRFLNSVNRVRHSFEGYLKGIFGGSLPAPDYHNPFYLAHTDDVVFGQETENTATEQMTDKIAITTNLRSHSGNYMFEIESDRPCIAIGITSYDITRVYDKSIERPFFHVNRFDWFNPFMQYIGDQPIYLQELGILPGSSSLDEMANFSYTLRHMEYKQRYSQCAGGFCNPKTDLDNWLFIAKDRRGTQSSINPDWIRSISAEFDKFFVSLTGYSLGTYFHFIVDDYNSCNASRPMAFAPQILG